jgi:hypothetical protein
MCIRLSFLRAKIPTDYTDYTDKKSKTDRACENEGPLIFFTRKYLTLSSYNEVSLGAGQKNLCNLCNLWGFSLLLFRSS